MFSSRLLALSSVILLSLSGCALANDDASAWGYCGLAPYDITNDTIKRHGLNESDPEDLRRFRSRMVPEMFWPHQDVELEEELVTLKQRQKQLSLTLFPLRIRVLYDKSLAVMHPSPGEMETYVRNFLLSAQTIFEQPELYNLVKLQLVVVEIAQLDKEFAINTTADEMLTKVDSYNQQVTGNRHDITLVLFHRNLFESINRGYGSVLAGLAGLGTFCNNATMNRGALIQTIGLNRVMILVHELAHTLGANHDGIAGNPCPDETFIMSRIAREGITKWSACTAQTMYAYLLQQHVFKCVYDKSRTDNSSPLNDRFNWLPRHPSRWPLPGMEVSLDKQCQMATDGLAKAIIEPFVVPQVRIAFDVCQILRCIIDFDSVVEIGPALTGSDCLSASNGAPGKCYQGRCSPLQRRGPINGVLKRCLNEFRHKDCAFFLLDHGLRFEREKIAAELGDVHEESASQCLDRFQSFESDTEK